METLFVHSQPVNTLAEIPQSKAEHKPLTSMPKERYIDIFNSPLLLASYRR
jgi:hypothetical protein